MKPNVKLHSKVQQNSNVSIKCQIFCVNECEIAYKSKIGFECLIECQIDCVNKRTTECAIAYHSKTSW